MNSTTIILTIWLVFILVLFGQGRIMRYFNLVDKRTMVGGEESYHKLNKLMSAGDVAIYRHEFDSKPTITVRVEYQISKSENNEVRVSGRDFDTVVELVYQASVAKGYIKE